MPSPYQRCPARRRRLPRQRQRPASPDGPFHDDGSLANRTSFTPFGVYRLMSEVTNRSVKTIKSTDSVNNLTQAHPFAKEVTRSAHLITTDNPSFHQRFTEQAPADRCRL